MAALRPATASALPPPERRAGGESAKSEPSLELLPSLEMRRIRSRRGVVLGDALGEAFGDGLGEFPGEEKGLGLPERLDALEAGRLRSLSGDEQTGDDDIVDDSRRR